MDPLELAALEHLAAAVAALEALRLAGSCHREPGIALTHARQALSYLDLRRRRLEIDKAKAQKSKEAA